MHANLATLLAASAVAGCTVRMLDHDPDAGARAAAEFARLTFVLGDLEGGYASLSDAARKATSFEKFREAVAAMHPRSRPGVVTPTEFEPIPGQAGMNIFLHGQIGEEHFHYRFVMEGTSQRGYRVAGLWRGSGPYPASKTRRPLRGADESSRAGR